jgi:hypothetical protein
VWDNGNPFDFIALKYGKERALELARKIKANKPILSRSTALLTRIASGEAHLGATAITAALGEIAKGAPLGVKPYKDIIPALNNQLCVVDKAPHPNIAKLFAAWHAVEGIHLIADAAGHYRALPGDENALTRLLTKWGKTGRCRALRSFPPGGERFGWGDSHHVSPLPVPSPVEGEGISKVDKRTSYLLLSAILYGEREKKTSVKNQQGAGYGNEDSGRSTSERAIDLA